MVGVAGDVIAFAVLEGEYSIPARYPASLRPDPTVVAPIVPHTFNLPFEALHNPGIVLQENRS